MAKLAGGMGTPDDWEDQEKIVDFLASRLKQRRISIFLGAGVSSALRLPKWGELIDGLFKAAGETRPVPSDNIRDPEKLALSAKYRNNEKLFAEQVRKALYQGFVVDSLKTNHYPLLSALGAMVMSSVRGTATEVVTFNYDDLLEIYLRWRGFVVESVPSLPAWNSATDVRVLHPHGFLPSDLSQPVPGGVVITQKDFERIVGDARNFWRQRITDILRSTTPIFVGLSGDDLNLTQMLTDVEGHHPSKSVDYYWGVRLTNKGDGNGDIWQGRGIRSFELPTHDDVPIFLMDVCRRAAEMRAT